MVDKFQNFSKASVIVIWGLYSCDIATLSGKLTFSVFVCRKCLLLHGRQVSEFLKSECHSHLRAIVMWYSNFSSKLTFSVFVCRKCQLLQGRQISEFLKRECYSHSDSNPSAELTFQCLCVKILYVHTVDRFQNFSKESAIVLWYNNVSSELIFQCFA